MNLITENRQTIKTTLLTLFLLGFCLPTIGQAQTNKTKIDYSKKSNILNPDTLQYDQKLIFWHFVKLTNKEVIEYESQKLKTEFEGLGITTKERARFVRAFLFFDTSMKNHKKSCEQWESFKDLAPKLN